MRSFTGRNLKVASDISATPRSARSTKARPALGVLKVGNKMGNGNSSIACTPKVAVLMVSFSTRLRSLRPRTFYDRKRPVCNLNLWTVSNRGLRCIQPCILLTCDCHPVMVRLVEFLMKTCSNSRMLTFNSKGPYVYLDFPDF